MFYDVCDDTWEVGEILKMGTVANHFFCIFVFLVVVLHKITTGTVDTTGSNLVVAKLCASCSFFLQ
jgi:hypothetical protein